MLCINYQHFISLALDSRISAFATATDSISVNLSFQQRPISQTLCGALQKEPNCKCLVLTVLIYGCLAAVTWCRCANVTKVHRVSLYVFVCTFRSQSRGTFRITRFISQYLRVEFSRRKTWNSIFCNIAKKKKISRDKAS